MTHRKIFAVILVASLALDCVLGGVFAHLERIPGWHGVYCALADSETLGGDCAVTRHIAYLVKFGELLLLVPLAGSALGLFTSGLSELHIRRHVNRAIKEIKDHVSDTAGGGDGKAC